MRHFQKIIEDIHVQPCLIELRGMAADFITSTDGSEFIDRDVKGRPAVPPGYRFLPKRSFGPTTLSLMGGALEYLAHQHYRQSISFRDAAVVGCPPQTRVPPHKDALASSRAGKLYRHQLALQCDDRAFFRIGRERARLRPGELWLCDVGDRTHEMHNASDQWRFVLRFDIRLDTGGQLVAASIAK